MTQSHPKDPVEPGPVPGPVPERSPGAAGPATGPESGETAGLVLVINTVLGGLGSLYLTTKSALITLTSALLVVLLIVVVKRRSGHASRPGRRDDRSGR
jgi:hypothetical protein